MLEQFIGSIKGYFYKAFPVDIFEKELPQTIKVPSMYFPQPNVMTLPHSKQTFTNNYTLDIQLFHKDTPTAMQKAKEITNEISKNKNQIPLLNQDGTEADRVITFEEIQCTNMENGIVQIRLEWDAHFKYI